MVSDENLEAIILAMGMDSLVGIKRRRNAARRALGLERHR